MRVHEPQRTNPRLRGALSRRRLVGVLGLAGIGALAACTAPSASPTAAPTTPPTAPATATSPGASPTAATQPTQAPTVAKAVAKWRIAVPEIKADTAFLVMGVEKGFFRDEGIDAEFVAVPSGTTSTQGVIAGEFDHAIGGPAAQLAALENGAEIRIVGALFSKVPHLLYVKQEVNSLEDLLGQPFATDAPGAFLYALSYALFVQANLDPTAVDFVNVGGSPAVFRALTTGRYAGGVSGSQYAYDLQQDPSIPLKVLFAVGDRLPNYLRNGEIVSAKALRDNRDVVVRALTAHVRGARYAVEHRDETIAWGVNSGGTDEATAAAGFDEYVNGRLVNTNYLVPRAQLDFTQQISVSIGQQSRVLPFDQVATEEIAAAIVERLGQHQY